MIKASQELGFGENWLEALEHVKTLHVAPGEQPDLIKNLALESIEFLEKHDLLTIPALAKETWRIEMMSPERNWSIHFLPEEKSYRFHFRPIQWLMSKS